MDIIIVTVEKGNKAPNSYQIVPKGLVVSKRPVLVCVGFDALHPIGTARLYVESGVIKAILTIDKSKYLDLYPAIAYTIIKQSGNKVTEFQVRQIGLSKTPNYHTTIKTIGEQLR